MKLPSYLKLKDTCRCTIHANAASQQSQDSLIGVIKVGGLESTKSSEHAAIDRPKSDQSPYNVI